VRKILLAAMVLLLVSGAILGYDIQTDGGPVTIKETTHGGTRWIVASEVAAALGGRTFKNPGSGRPVLEVSGYRILFSTTTPVVSVNGKVVRLAHQPYLDGDLLWIPEEVLGHIHVRRRAPDPAVPPAPSAGVVLDLILSKDGTRLTLRGSGALSIPWDLEGSVLVVGGKGHQAIALSGASAPAGLVERAEPASPSVPATTIFFARGFRKLDTVRLRNPDRLVFLLKGSVEASNTIGSSLPPPPPSNQAFRPGPLVAPHERTPELDIVVLDPGHGGSDTGAKGPGGLQEKDLVLQICKILQETLSKNGFKVLLTRDSDRAMDLAMRTSYANSQQADVFVSVHLNASPSRMAKGTETYYHSTEATDQWAMKIADRENALVKRTNDREDLALVLWDLAQTRYIRESAVLAEMIQRSFNRLHSLKDRGVRQAPFAVLQGAQMPSVLLEVGFLTNPREAKLLASEEFQQQVADTFLKALLDFKEHHDQPETPAEP